MEFERSLFRVHKRSVAICYNYNRHGGGVRVMPVCMRCTEICCMLVSSAAVLALHSVCGVLWCGVVGRGLLSWVQV